MQASYDENVVSEQDIIQAVVDAGYGASPAESGSPQSAGAPQKSASDIAKEEMKAMKHRLIGSILFLIPVMYIAMHHMFYEWFGIPVPEGFQYVFHGDENAITFAFTQFLLILPIMYLNRKYYVNGFRNLFQGAPNMDSLVGLGSMAAAVYGVFAIFRMSWGMGHGDWALVAQYSTNLYFESAGMIVTLIDIGKFLEARAKGKTSTAIENSWTWHRNRRRSCATASKRSSPSKTLSSAMKSSSAPVKASRLTASFLKARPASMKPLLPAKVFLLKTSRRQSHIGYDK